MTDDFRNRRADREAFVERERDCVKPSFKPPLRFEGERLEQFLARWVGALNEWASKELRPPSYVLGVDYSRGFKPPKPKPDFVTHGEQPVEGVRERIVPRLIEQIDDIRTFCLGVESTWHRRINSGGWDLAQDLVSDEVQGAVENVPQISGRAAGLLSLAVDCLNTLDRSLRAIDEWKKDARRRTDSGDA